MRYVYTQFCIFEGFCAYEKYVMNFHTQLLRFSHTQQCDRATSLVIVSGAVSPVIQH